MNYEYDFLKSLAITIFIETSVLWILIKITERKSTIKIWLIIITGIVASFSTLPYLWFILPVFVKTSLYYTIIGELFATIFESFILFGFLKTEYKKCLIYSTICNLISYLCGVIIYRL
jgi:hypothetical protein